MLSAVWHADLTAEAAYQNTSSIGHLIIWAAQDCAYARYIVHLAWLLGHWSKANCLLPMQLQNKSCVVLPLHHMHLPLNVCCGDHSTSQLRALLG